MRGGRLALGRGSDVVKATYYGGFLCPDYGKIGISVNERDSGGGLSFNSSTLFITSLRASIQCLLPAATRTGLQTTNITTDIWLFKALALRYDFTDTMHYAMFLCMKIWNC